jgi:hypothetical protein
MRVVRMLALSAAVTLSLALAAPAAAQQTSVQRSFGNLIAALNNISVQIEELEALNDLTVSDVRVLNVEDVLNGNRVRALNNALNRNDVDIVRLRNVLNDNEIIKKALNNNDVAVSDVVAIEVLSGGDIVLYFQ